VADDWCWFVLREKYCWLVGDGWFILREKYVGWWLISQTNKAVIFISSQGSGWEQHGSKCAALRAVAENIFTKESNIDLVKTFRTTPSVLFME
jgi:hypothetical protein